MAQPLITVIIPAYNREATIDRTLRSVASQTYRPFSVVLVDNGSKDTTKERMERWKSETESDDLKISVVEERRHGAPTARNTGLALAETEWVMFFDSDDEMLPNHVEDFARTIRSHPEVQIVGRRVVCENLDGSRHTGRFKATKDILFQHIFHAVLATQRYAAKASLVRNVGGWQPKAWGWNDYELGLRLLLQNPSVVEVEGEPSVLMHQTADSITGLNFSHSPAKWEDTLNLCEEALTKAGRDDLKVWIDCRRAILAANYRREGSRVLARKLMDKFKPGLRLRLVYYHQRILGHGASYLARLLFPKTKSVSHKKC